MRVYLAGEGLHELGDWFNLPQYRGLPPRLGVIEALLRRTCGESFSVVGAVPWCKIVKYRAGGHRAAETRNVLGAALMAQEAQCDVLVFVRDRDGDVEREQDIEEGIKQVTGIAVAGSVVREMIESWIRSLRGELGAEALTDPAASLRDCDLTGLVESVEKSAIGSLPNDAHSLRLWIECVQRVLEGPPRQGTTRT